MVDWPPQRILHQGWAEQRSGPAEEMPATLCSEPLSADSSSGSTWCSHREGLTCAALRSR
jgi:hypothetical protein